MISKDLENEFVEKWVWMVEGALPSLVFGDFGGKLLSSLSTLVSCDMRILDSLAFFASDAPSSVWW